MTSLSLCLTLQVAAQGAREHIVLAAREHVAESLRRVTVNLDGVSKPYEWTEKTALSIPLDCTPGTHRLELDFGGVLPVGVLTLPESVRAITAPLPPLVNAADGQKSQIGIIWNPATPATGIETLVDSLFAVNPQLTALTGTFAGLSRLKTIPCSLFFPLIYVKCFSGVFAGTALTEIPDQLFFSNRDAFDFSDAFRGCRALHHIPENLFSMNPQASLFDRTFADSALQLVPAAIFRNAARSGSFVETFARTDVRAVPAGLMHGLDPIDVDGMFEPKEHLPHDPMLVRSGPKFADDIFADTRAASGVLTQRCPL